jgi:hypothetical protein
MLTDFPTVAVALVDLGAYLGRLAPAMSMHLVAVAIVVTIWLISRYAVAHSNGPR